MTATRAEDADEILCAVADKYKSCRTYRDSGHAVGYTSVDFKTFFKRPQFRFDWTVQTPKGEIESAIWGNQYEAWQKQPDGMKEVDGIRMAIAGATGVSVGTAPAISMMLMPEVSRNSKHLLIHKYQFIGETSCNGFECYEIRANYQEESFVQLFISKDDLCIRRVIRQFVMTLAGREQAIEVLRQRDPGLAQTMVEHCAKTPPKPSHAIVDYIDVAFDIDILDDELTPRI